MGIAESLVLAVAVATAGIAVPAADQEPAGGAAGRSQAALEEARRRELDQLQLQIGRYTSGEAVVYAGMLEAAEGGDARGLRALPRGRVVAALEERAGTGGGAGPEVALTVVSAEHGLWLRLAQSADAPGVTRTTRLRPLHGSPGITASCRACLADLRRRPETIRLDRFEAAGRLHDVSGTAFRVQLAGRLERVPLAALELADLEPLNPGVDSFLRDEAAGFTRRGGEGVRRVERQLRRRVPPPPGSPPQTRCERVTRYSAERFVELEDPSRFGVRDLRLLGAEICCFDHDGHGHAEECSAEGGG